MSPKPVYPEEYEATCVSLLSDVKAKCNSRLVIIEPFMFSDDLTDPVFSELRRYVEIVRRIAEDSMPFWFLCKV